MFEAIRRLLGSRKFVLLLVGVISAVGARLGLDADPQLVGMVVGLFAVAIGAVAYEDGQAKSGGAIAGGNVASTPEQAAKLAAELEAASK